MELDNEELVVGFESLVDTYNDFIPPFAVDIMKHLA